MLKKIKSNQFFLFLITGGIAACVNFGSCIAFKYWFDFSSSIILAYVMGMITAFILAKYFVFKNSQQSLHASMLYFSLVNLLAVAQTWAVSMGLAYYLLPALGILNFTEEIAHAIGVIVPVFSSYFGHKHLSFKA
ncbi:MAG: GtrA family protein [Legionella sp.]|nr:GtrA family protein [Legionella sp.]